MKEEEKLKAINDNAELALEFTKEFNECIKLQVPKECAALAVLHDLADWKDQHPRKGLWDAEKVMEYLNSYFSEIELSERVSFLNGLRKAMED